MPSTKRIVDNLWSSLSLVSSASLSGALLFFSPSAEVLPASVSPWEASFSVTWAPPFMFEAVSIS